MKYLVIANPEAGTKTLDTTLEQVRSAFEAREIIHEVRLTQFPGHAAKIAAEGLSEGFTHMISLGGDGTSSEIVSSIRDTETVFGIIPGGSGNDFPKAAGIPLDTQAAVDNIFSGRPRKADVAFVDEKCFINGFGVGMDGAVAHDFGELGLRRLGSFGYIVGAVIEAFRFQGFVSKVDGEVGTASATGRKLLLFGASNGPFQGGKFNLAPGADIFDGHLDIHIISDMHPIGRLFKIQKVLEGRHEGLREVSIVRVKQLRFETFTDLPAHMDGEIFTLRSGKHSIRIGEQRVNIIVPA
ncbi:MAG: diacylglycerol kinase family lipid kinase [Candidatus Dadabacteria bacterium]|nr:diacylglycerol kinase family lipid kinase [Candidatus Dadabacteria bacterium]